MEEWRNGGKEKRRIELIPLLFQKGWPKAGVVILI